MAECDWQHNDVVNSMERLCIEKHPADYSLLQYRISTLYTGTRTVLEFTDCLFQA